MRMAGESDAIYIYIIFFISPTSFILIKKQKNLFITFKVDKNRFFLTASLADYKVLPCLSSVAT